jgi:hypothetical protein
VDNNPLGVLHVLSLLRLPFRHIGNSLQFNNSANFVQEFVRDHKVGAFGCNEPLKDAFLESTNENAAQAKTARNPRNDFLNTGADRTDVTLLNANSLRSCKCLSVQLLTFQL